MILKNKGLELAWVENQIEAFFFHIQGSGRLRFPDGEVKKILVEDGQAVEFGQTLVILK